MVSPLAKGHPPLLRNELGCAREFAKGSAFLGKDALGLSPSTNRLPKGPRIGVEKPSSKWVIDRTFLL
jgi:hypothetical protein